jgi:hypothetical protein
MVTDAWLRRTSNDELPMSRRSPRDAERGLWFDLTVDTTHELARDTDRVSALVGVTARRSDRGVTTAAAMEHTKPLLVPRTYLRLGLDHRFRLESIRQIRPTESDLTGHQVPQPGGAVDIPLLDWGEETRGYLVDLGVDPATLPYEEVRAARAEIVAGFPNETPMPCSSPVPISVQRLRYNDPPPVNQAVSWAQDLIRLVTMEEDGSTGLRDDITCADLLIFDTGTVDHSHVPPPSASVAGPERAGAGQVDPADLVRRSCPRGHVTIASAVRYCEEEGCGYEFTDEPGVP